MTAREIDALRAALLVEQGILPDAGGWMEQSVTFVASYPLLSREIQRWREFASEQERRRNAQKQKR